MKNWFMSASGLIGPARGQGPLTLWTRILVSFGTGNGNLLGLWNIWRRI